MYKRCFWASLGYIPGYPVHRAGLLYLLPPREHLSGNVREKQKDGQGFDGRESECGDGAYRPTHSPRLHSCDSAVWLRVKQESPGGRKTPEKKCPAGQQNGFLQLRPCSSASASRSMRHNLKMHPVDHSATREQRTVYITSRFPALLLLLLRISGAPRLFVGSGALDKMSPPPNFPENFTYSRVQVKCWAA